MITLYWSPNSSASCTLWMLEELGEPYRLRWVDIRADPRRDPSNFLAASPMAKVPAIRNGGEVVSRSAPICLWLADRYAPERHAPRPAAPGRAAFLYWMFYTPAAIEPAMMEKFMGLMPNEAAAPWGTWDLTLDVLKARLAEGSWTVGGSFSAADVMIAATCRMMAKFGLVSPDADMSAYLDRCEARPGYLRAVKKEGLHVAGETFAACPSTSCP